MALWVRSNALRILFALTLAWALLGLFMEEIFGWVPDAGRGAIETALIAVVLLVCAGITAWIVRRRPTFLLAPAGISRQFWLTRSLVLPLFVGVLLAIVFGAVSYAEIRLRSNASDPQYGVSVAWAIVWYPAILTPVLSVVAIGRAAARRFRAGEAR